MTAVSKNVYIDKLDDIVNGYNNTYHRTIKMKPADVNNNTHIDFKKKVNDKDPKFKVGDHVRISKQSIFIRHDKYKVGNKNKKQLKNKNKKQVCFYFLLYKFLNTKVFLLKDIHQFGLKRLF